MLRQCPGSAQAVLRQYFVLLCGYSPSLFFSFFIFFARCVGGWVPCSRGPALDDSPYRHPIGTLAPPPTLAPPHRVPLDRTRARTVARTMILPNTNPKLDSSNQVPHIPIPIFPSTYSHPHPQAPPLRALLCPQNFCIIFKVPKTK